MDVLYNKKWKFRLVVPEITDNELLPLFVYLHGGALTINPNAHTQANCLIEPTLENTKAYILRPNVQGPLWNDPANESKVINLVNFTIQNLNIDPNKVVVVGYSDGGELVFF